MSILQEVLKSCSEGDVIVCTRVAPINDEYLTENKSYTVHSDTQGLYIIDDEGDKLGDVSSLFVKEQKAASSMFNED